MLDTSMFPEPLATGRCAACPPGGCSDAVSVVRDRCQSIGKINAMAQTTAQRQKAFKDSMRDAGFVRLEAYVTKEQREKFRRMGGDEWLRKKIEQAKEAASS